MSAQFIAITLLTAAGSSCKHQTKDDGSCEDYKPVLHGS